MVVVEDTALLATVVLADDATKADRPREKAELRPVAAAREANMATALLCLEE